MECELTVDIKWAWKSVVFENCFALTPTYAKLDLLKIFIVLDDGELWPNPITEGPYRNCSEVPSGEPIDNHERVMKILSEYYDDPEQAYYDLFVKPFQF